MEVPAFDNKKNGRRSQAGFVTLISLLIVSAIAVVIAVSLVLLGLGSSRTGFAFEQSAQSRALANACVEEALQQIRDSAAFSGSDSLTLGQGTCAYNITNLGGQNRRVETTGTVGSIVRKVRININRLRPTINVTTWEEIGDF